MRTISRFHKKMVIALLTEALNMNISYYFALPHSILHYINITQNTVIRVCTKLSVLADIYSQKLERILAFL